MTALSVRNLNVWYGDKHTLNDVSVEIPLRRITCIIGPSGCGKSTLLKALNRLLDLNDQVKVSGQVRLDDVNIYDPDVDVTEVRTRVGLLAQKPFPLPMSIFDNVA
ncbi:MAG: ATP-binding cassette domain-containing protein, partial [Anaerolineae bacterium]|nr:ATP-binding cassette domain-containing protein [Anaerolineae bacterium]